jgi:hypothetical protein
MVNRTWRMTPALAERVNATAAELGLYPSDLVRFLLTMALDELDAGRLALPRRSRGCPYEVDWERVDRSAPGGAMAEPRRIQGIQRKGVVQSGLGAGGWPRHRTDATMGGDERNGSELA